MGQPIIDMPKLPEASHLHEYTCTMIHGAPYFVMMDGVDCYVFHKAQVSGKDVLTELCKLAGSDITERLGIALLRAATTQRAEEAKRR
jgi:hypothetical protein